MNLIAEFERICNPYPLRPGTMQKEGEPNFLYLIFCPVTMLTKIGITAYPQKRKKDLQNKIGLELWLIFYIEFAEECDESAKMIERYLHNQFAEKRKYGEWFDLTLWNILRIWVFLWHIEGEYIVDNVIEYYKKWQRTSKQTFISQPK